MRQSLQAKSSPVTSPTVSEEVFERRPTKDKKTSEEDEDEVRLLSMRQLRGNLHTPLPYDHACARIDVSTKDDSEETLAQTAA